MISGQYFFDGNYDYHDDHDNLSLISLIKYDDCQSVISDQDYFGANHDYHDDHDEYDDCLSVISGQDYFDRSHDYHDDCQSVISSQYDLCYLHLWKSLL